MRTAAKRGRRTRITPLAIFLAAAATPVPARELPLWEAGAGVAALSIPDYRGSEETGSYLIPIPYFVYRGETFRIDREGLSGKLFRSKRLKLDLSVNIGQPTDSDDNRARRGMPDLHPTLELGPSLKVLLHADKRRVSAWSVQLPLRAVIATDLSDAEFAGWLFSPHLNYEDHDFGPGGPWRFEASAGPLFATRDYHEYFYGVAPRFATPERPAYAADGGYSGFRLTLTLTRRFRSFWVGAFARYDSLERSVFEDSPLLTKDSSFMAGIGIAWVLATSERTVEHDPKIWW